MLVFGKINMGGVTTPPHLKFLPLHEQALSFNFLFHLLVAFVTISVAQYIVSNDGLQ
jgi:hypothetical protein